MSRAGAAMVGQECLGPPGGQRIQHRPLPGEEVERQAQLVRRSGGCQVDAPAP